MWYCDYLSKLLEAIQKKHPGLLKSGILMLDDNTRRYLVMVMQNHIATLGWECQHYLPYSPDLIPSDFHQFTTLKKNLGEKCFGSNGKVKQAIKCIFCVQSPEFFLESLLRLIKQHDKCLNVLGSNVKK